MAETGVKLSEAAIAKESALVRALRWVEQIGNRLPHPFVLFLVLGLILVLVSGLVAGTAVSVPGSDKKEVAQSLLTRDNLIWIVSDLHKNFLAFPPLAAVMTMMLAVGVAEGSGLFRAALKRALTGVPRVGVTAAVMLLGICGNLASDAGIVFIPALSGIVFASMGRNPLVGVLAAYAATNGGFCANLLITDNDAILTPITQAAAKVLPITAEYPAHLAMNWYFMIASTLILVPVGVFVTERIVAPMFGDAYERDGTESGGSDLGPGEAKGLRAAGLALLAFIVVILLLTIPAGAPLRDAQSGSILPKSPFMQSLMSLIFLLFIIPGLAYGYAAGTIRNHKDVVSMMGKGIGGLTGFLVVAFAAGQFLAWFKKANLATVIAVKGAEFLKAAGLTGAPLVVVFIVLITLVNLFVYSSSAKWTLVAPIFVPMFSLLGLSPALTQAVYRIGDSCGDILSPIYPYLPVVLGLMQKYKKDTGVGTVLATMLPYAVCFLIAWTLLAVVWVVLRIPVGPGAGVYL